MCNSNEDHSEREDDSAPDFSQEIRNLLENLRHGSPQTDKSLATPADQTLDLLRDNAALSKAQETLSQRSQDKSLDVVLRARICAMLGVINLFLDPDLPYTWRKASMVVAKAQSAGPNRARNIRRWIFEFVKEGKLPLHSYSYKKPTALEDEGVAQEIQKRLSEKAKTGFIKTEDLCEIVASDSIQGMFLQLGIKKPSISLSTAQRWLEKLNWKYRNKSNGMYIDGHKRDDVVAYRDAFVNRWAEYERRFHIWNDADVGATLARPPHPLPLILVTHDESTFYQNDQRKTCWGHQDSRPTPQPKGEGQSLMISEFLTTEWGRLCNGDRCVDLPFFSLSYLTIALQGGSHHIQAWEESRWIFQLDGTHGPSRARHRHLRGQDKWPCPRPIHV